MPSYIAALSRLRRLRVLAALTGAALALAMAGSVASAQADYSFPAHFTSNGCPGENWQYTLDGGGFNNEYVLSSGSQGCAGVDWYVTGPASRQTCDWWLFIPSSYGNANVYPGISTDTLYGVHPAINENDYSDAFAYLGNWTNVQLVRIGSNNGETGTYIGVGTDNSLYADNCH